MRLMDLDDFAKSNQNGKTMMLRVLEKWEKEHPLNEIRIPYGDGWEVTITRKKTNE